MYILYSRPGTAAFAVQATLEEIGAPYDLRDVELGASFSDVNPLGQVPALALPDGTLMTESAAIVIHLADAHPQAGLAPAPGTAARARWLRWLVFLATNLYISFRHVYHADAYAPDEATQKAVVAMARQTLRRDFGLAEQALEPGPYLLGDTFSAADIYLAMFPDWHWNRAAVLSELPRIARLRDLVLARPAVARAHAQHGEG